MLLYSEVPDTSTTKPTTCVWGLRGDAQPADPGVPGIWGLRPPEAAVARDQSGWEGRAGGGSRRRLQASNKGRAGGVASGAPPLTLPASSPRPLALAPPLLLLLACRWWKRSQPAPSAYIQTKIVRQASMVARDAPLSRPVTLTCSGNGGTSAGSESGCWTRERKQCQVSQRAGVIYPGIKHPPSSLQRS